MKVCTLVVILMFSCMAAAVAGSDEKTPENAAVPLRQDLGDHHFPITTGQSLAQRYFDQGLILAYAFNHAESIRAFRYAIKLDPGCAMCYWGIAYASGPNINAPMMTAAAPVALEAARKAQTLAARATPREKAYIAALASRYGADNRRAELDAAYAREMRDLVRRYPDDPDAGTLLADALMNLHPWDYWTVTGQPKPWTDEIVAVLERVLERTPLHPGANHLYIHAVEASARPERALPSADRLGGLVPGAGHLVHMPAHIYIRTGRYQQAAEANRRAVAVDRDYLAQPHSDGIYPLAYVPHNHHFLWAAASRQGRGTEALAAARSTAAQVDTAMMRQPGMAVLQHFYATPLYAATRFGRWEEILQQPAPDPGLGYLSGVWHYARGMAWTACGALDQARSEWEALGRIAGDPAIAEMRIMELNKVGQVLAIAHTVLAGEMAARSGDLKGAVEQLGAAVALEDGLRYNEPPDWYYPVRQSLGAVLLRAGEPARAEQVYREDLRRNPENGWSLFGLMQSLRAQHRSDEANQVEARFQKAWARADIVLQSSRLLD